VAIQSSIPQCKRVNVLVHGDAALACNQIARSLDALFQQFEIVQNRLEEDASLQARILHFILSNPNNHVIHGGGNQAKEIWRKPAPNHLVQISPIPSRPLFGSHLLNNDLVLVDDFQNFSLHVTGFVVVAHVRVAAPSEARRIFNEARAKRVKRVKNN
jgi:hypothetical protein|tara:strand:- start:89 stop:562 length:474 start_codon:yes stop_codon:yes gene_type:complete